MLCVDQGLIISSVIDFPIVGVFVVVGHRWGRMIRFGESERGGSRLASEVRESSVVFKSGSSQTCLGAVASLRELGAAI